MHSYKEFWNEVKTRLRSYLASYEDVSDENIEKFMREEKDIIDGEYRHYKNGDRNKDLTPEALYKACASAAAYCLNMCY